MVALEKPYPRKALVPQCYDAGSYRTCQRKIRKLPHKVQRPTSKHQFHLVPASMTVETPWGIPTIVSQKLLANAHVPRARYQLGQARRACD